MQIPPPAPPRTHINSVGTGGGGGGGDGSKFARSSIGNHQPNEIKIFDPN